MAAIIMDAAKTRLAAHMRDMPPGVDWRPPAYQWAQEFRDRLVRRNNS
jgi:hypothetical protein